MQSKNPKIHPEPNKLDSESIVAIEKVSEERIKLDEIHRASDELENNLEPNKGDVKAQSLRQLSVHQSSKVDPNINKEPVHESMHETNASFSQIQVNTYKPYQDAPNELSITNWNSPSYYKYRWKILSLFDKKIPFLRFSIGFILMFLILLAAYVVIQIFVTISGESRVGSTASFPSILIGITFSFATYNSIYCFLLGISFENQLFWHKFLAVIGLASGIVHGVYGILDDDRYGTGIPLLAAIALLVVTGLFPYFKYTFFSVFLYIHWIGFITVLVFSVLHGAIAIIIIGGAFWGVDMLIRFIIIIRNRKNLKAVYLKRLPGNVVRVKFLKENFKYKAGQYMFICVPKVSYFEWHPFSFSSAPHDKYVTIHIRALGNWTKQLYKKVKDDKDEKWSIYTHGPYGLPTLDIDGPKYKIFLLFTGGIGITPLQSIAKELVYQNLQGRIVIKIIFVWSVREVQLVNNVLKFDEELLHKAEKHRIPLSFQPADIIESQLDSDVLDVYCHLTQHKQPDSGLLNAVDSRKQSYLKYGRPSVKDYFDKASELAKKHKESEVAVLVCGPTPMVDECRKTAYKQSNHSVKFDFHSEVFEF